MGCLLVRHGNSKAEFGRGWPQPRGSQELGPYHRARPFAGLMGQTEVVPSMIRTSQRAASCRGLGRLCDPRSPAPR
jgi:hypothetical protein